MIKKAFFGFAIFLLAVDMAGAQNSNQPWWYTLEMGKLQFRDGAYGNALIAFEDARRQRLSQYERMEQDMILLLSSPELRRLGDSLEWIEMYIAERRETRAQAILAELYHRVPKESLQGSAQRVLEELDRLKSYPEAEFWLGETYEAEGELALALGQYERAWQKRELLETPGFEAEILYKLMDIHRIRGNYQEMERRAIEIAEGFGPSGNLRDNLWGTDSSHPIRVAMSRILENEGVNRFLTLYRYRSVLTERAHRVLGFFYYASNRYIPAAEHLMFAFLIQNTVLIEEVIKREFDFTFTSLENLMEFAQSRPELKAFIEDTEYYRTIYYLASALYATGKNRPSSQLLTFLANSTDSREWGERARRNSSP